MNRSTVYWIPEGVRLPLENLAPVPEYRPQAADVETYRREGVVCLRGAFREWVEPLRAGLERNLENPDAYAFPCESTGRGEAGRFFDSYCNWLRIPEYRDYVLGSCAASMAGRFMGSSRAQFFHEHAFVKEPGTTRATPWHQDLPYYCVDGSQTVSIYVALDEAPETVAPRFVAGSHRWQKLFYPLHFVNGEHFDHEDAMLEDVPADLEERHPVRAWALAPGDAVLFDFRCLHGTREARVERRRRAFSTRWLGDDVRHCRRPGQTSPPYPDIGLEPGEPMREDWFPVLWRDREARRPAGKEHLRGGDSVPA